MASTVRVVIGVVAVLLALLALPRQSADLLAGLIGVGRSGAGEVLRFHLALAAFALGAWYWARAVLSARFPEILMPNVRAGAEACAPVDEAAWEWLPRGLFAAAAACGVVTALRSGAWAQAALVVVWAAALLALLVKRRRWFGPRDDLAPQLRAQAGWECRWEIGPRCRQVLRLAPGGAFVAAAWLGLGCCVLAGAALGALGLDTEAVRRFVPAWPGLAALLGGVFPGPGALFLLTALALPPLALLGFAVDGWRLPERLRVVMHRPPVLLPLLLLAAVLPLLLPLHTVPTLPPAAGSVSPAMRAGLPQLFASWVQTCAPGGNGPVRPVIVAASGGAADAALWTARVLQSVQAALPPGPGRPAIFAISSVGGGALGAGAWVSLVAGQEAVIRCRTEAAVPPAPVSAADRALSRLGGDAVAPLFAGLLADDVPHALLGWLPVLFGDAAGGGDRAAAFAHGLGELWRRANQEPAGLPWTHGAVPFGDPYLRLFYTAGAHPRAGVPLWLVQTTDAATGRRVLFTPFASDTAATWPFRDSGDALATLGADVSISAVITNAARAAFLLPPGTLLPQRAGRPADDSPVSVIDGGYFDDTGLLTALELGSWLQGPEARAAAGGRQVEPILVEVSAVTDPALGGEAVVRCGSPRRNPATPGLAAPPRRLLGPVIGPDGPHADFAGVLERVARDRYCARAEKPSQAYFHFALQAPPQGSLPLNWVLSRPAAVWIWRHAMQSCDNALELARLAAVATGVVAPSSCALPP
jgi:hypothetical protein